MIDWDVARRTAATFAGSGPEVEAHEAAGVVEALRSAAEVASAPVSEYTGLKAVGTPAPVLVVDRRRWTEANLSSFQDILEPVMTKLADQAPGRISRAVGSRVSGAELGGLLAFMSSKVLGQFDPFWTGPDGEAGRLLLVAPNIVDVERKLEVDPDDFRLWVCLHEETHRLQFTGVPWMRGHVRGLLDEFSDATELDPQALSRFLSEGVGELARIVRGESDASIADLFQNERQKAVVDQMTGVMSLLEGHADVVMDGVGPDYVPSVQQIRRKFNQRRKGAGGIDRIIRRLLGLEGKMRQYRDGAVFVREVVDTVGHDGFSAVWAGPENLPSKAEILEPAAWVARVRP